jgi:methyl-accepting chemotaxis protein
VIGKVVNMQNKLKKPVGSLNLTTILAIAFFSLSVLGLLFSGGLQIFSYSQTNAESIAGKLQLIASKATGTVSSFILEKISILETIARISSLHASSRGNWSETVYGLLSSQPSFRQCILWDKNGNILEIASRMSRVESEKATGLYSNELISRVNQGDNYISPVNMDELSSEPIILIAVPEKNVLGDIMGILAAEVNLKFMLDMMINIEVGKQGHAYVVDKQGNLIAFRDLTRILKKENLAGIKIVDEFIQETENSSSGKTYRYKGITGKPVVGTYVSLNTPDWAVIIELPEVEAYQEVIQNAVRAIIITLIIAVLAGVVGIILARRLAIPLVKLTNIATRIAEGEMALKAPVSGIKEVAGLAVVFNNMTTRLNNKAEEFKRANEILLEIIEKAKEIIVNLNSSTNEIEAATQEQTTASNQNASGITEVSATLQELTITAKQITKNVGELVFSSEEGIKFLEQSEKQLEQIVQELDEVGEISKKNTTQIGELGKRSILINELVELIKEIANKTNILSINASIEASRGSESGAGFSVVAAEIRELSKEIINSAKTVEKAAKEIQDFLNLIIVTSKDESEKVINSVQLVKTIFDNMENIIGKINDNYSFTQKIDVSIKQQEKGSIQASETMKQMAEIARQSAETSREVLLAVKDIAALGVELDHVVAKYKTQTSTGVDILH